MFTPNSFLDRSVKVVEWLEMVLNERLKTLVFDDTTVLPFSVPLE